MVRSLCGSGDYPTLLSENQMRADALDSPQIRRTQHWHDDRRANRDYIKRQGSQAQGDIPVAAVVPSRIKCEVCGVFIEAEYHGNSCHAKSIYFWPVEDNLVKMATKTCHIHRKILTICGGCAARKKAPSQYRETDRKKIGLPLDYAIVKPADWARFPTHTDLKLWLLWQRTLCEYLIFYPRPFLVELSLWLQKHPEEQYASPTLQPFGTLTGLPIEQGGQVFPLKAEASIPLAQASQPIHAQLPFHVRPDSSCEE